MKKSPEITIKLFVIYSSRIWIVKINRHKYIKIECARHILKGITLPSISREFTFSVPDCHSTLLILVNLVTSLILQWVLFFVDIPKHNFNLYILVQSIVVMLESFKDKRQQVGFIKEDISCLQIFFWNGLST